MSLRDFSLMSKAVGGKWGRWKVTRENLPKQFGHTLEGSPSPTRARSRLPPQWPSRGLASPQLAPGPQVRKDPGQRWDLGRLKATL